MYKQFWLENLNERDHLEDPDKDKRTDNIELGLWLIT
jgi:hypothetical protein